MLKRNKYPSYTQLTLPLLDLFESQPRPPSQWEDDG